MSKHSALAAIALLLAAPISALAQSSQLTTAPAPTAQQQYVMLPTQVVQQQQSTVAYASPPVEEGRAREIAWGPGPIGLTLAALGRRMATLDRRYVWRVERTAYTRTHKTVVYQQVPHQQHGQPATTYVIQQPQVQCATTPVFQYQPMTPMMVPQTSAQAPDPPEIRMLITPSTQH